MPARFELKKSSNGKFRWNLLAANGQVIATSQMYESKQAAQNGIRSVRKSAADAELVDETAPAKKAAPSKKSPSKKKATAKKATKKAATKKRSAAKKPAAKKATKKKTGSKKSPAKRSGATKRTR